MKRALLALTILTITIPSCTIEKRLHRGGWHVEWKGHYRNAGDDKKDESRSGTVDDTAVKTEPIRTAAIPAAKPGKKSIEIKSGETPELTEEAAVVNQFTQTKLASGSPETATTRSLTDETPGSAEEDTREPKTEVSAEAEPADEGQLPIDPLILAAYIMAGVILLGLFIYAAILLTPLAWSIPWTIGWIFPVGYLFLAIANIVVLGLAGARRDNMRDTYRYLPTWPVWLATFLPLFIAILLFVLIIVAWGW